MQTVEPTPWHRSFEVVEACRRDARINARLRELLGGVPTGCAPLGAVVELPIRKSTGEAVERAAADALSAVSVDRCAEFEETAA